MVPSLKVSDRLAARAAEGTSFYGAWEGVMVCDLCKESMLSLQCHIDGMQTELLQS